MCEGFPDKSLTDTSHSDMWHSQILLLRTIGFLGLSFPKLFFKTDNEVEGFHNKLNFTIGARSPNMWRFFKSPQGIQSETEKLIVELNTGVTGKNQDKKYIKTSKRIKTVTGNWSNLGLEAYLKAIAYNF